MARRRRGTSLEEVTLQFVAVLALLCFIHPQTRAAVFGLGMLVVYVVLFAVAGLIAFALIRKARSRARADEAALESQVRVQVPPWEVARPSRPVADSDERYMPPEMRTKGSALQETFAPGEDALRPENAADAFSESPFTRSAERVPLAYKLRSIDWFQFEKLMELVYCKQGYEVERRGGANPDGGIDLVLTKDCERTAVQCKHWRKWDVGVTKVRELVGAMTDAKIDRGILVTISDYTDQAKDFADRNGVEIVGHNALADLLERLEADFDPEIQDLLNDTRKFCPRCESEMVVRSGSYGDFWGCSCYPRCRHKERLRDET